MLIAIEGPPPTFLMTPSLYEELANHFSHLLRGLESGIFCFFTIFLILFVLYAFGRFFLWASLSFFLFISVISWSHLFIVVTILENWDLVLMPECGWKRSGEEKFFPWLRLLIKYVFSCFTLSHVFSALKTLFLSLYLSMVIQLLNMLFNCLIMIFIFLNWDCIWNAGFVMTLNLHCWNWILDEVFAVPKS